MSCWVDVLTMTTSKATLRCVAVDDNVGPASWGHKQAKPGERRRPTWLARCGPDPQPGRQQVCQATIYSERTRVRVDRVRTRPEQHEPSDRFRELPDSRGIIFLLASFVSYYCLSFDRHKGQTTSWPTCHRLYVAVLTCMLLWLAMMSWWIRIFCLIAPHVVMCRELLWKPIDVSTTSNHYEVAVCGMHS
jgi:hypothetical protein